MEIINVEAHDTGLPLAILAQFGYVTHGLLQCRTGAPLYCVVDGCTDTDAGVRFAGDGFETYDTGQAHILTHITFRRCGMSNTLQWPLTGGGAGCGDGSSGCRELSAVWNLLGHSDTFTPEFMQAVSAIRYEDCGQTFRFENWMKDSGLVSANGMNSKQSERMAALLDADGSATGLDTATIMGCAKSDAGDWWRLDDECLHDVEGELWFLLLATCYLLLATYHLLRTTYYSLHPTYYLLLTTYSVLLTKVSFGSARNAASGRSARCSSNGRPTARSRRQRSMRCVAQAAGTTSRACLRASSSTGGARGVGSARPSP